MSLSFLCSIHRDWVYFHPKTALKYLEDTQNQGEVLLQENNWNEAIVFLGSAFDTTEILMTLQGIENTYLLNRFTSLAIMLADCFDKQNALNNRELILSQAEQKLKEAADVSLGNKPRLAFIQKCILAIRVQKGQNLISGLKSYIQLPAKVH